MSEPLYVVNGISLPKRYRINWEKINSLDDLKRILKALFRDLYIEDTIKQFDEIKDLLSEC